MSLAASSMPISFSWKVTKLLNIKWGRVYLPLLRWFVVILIIVLFFKTFKIVDIKSISFMGSSFNMRFFTRVKFHGVHDVVRINCRVVNINVYCRLFGRQRCNVCTWGIFMRMMTSDGEVVQYWVCTISKGSTSYHGHCQRCICGSSCKIRYTVVVTSIIYMKWLLLKEQENFLDMSPQPWLLYIHGTKVCRCYYI